MRTFRKIQTPRCDLPRIAGGAIVLGLVVVALTPVAVMAATRSRARTSAACSNETVNAGKYVGKETLRFVLIGSVSCAKAHSLVSTYFHKVATGQCGQHNNFCDLHFPGGWYCSIFFATESQQTGGAIAGCAQPSTGAKIRLFKHARSPLHVSDFLSPDGKIWCDLNDSRGLREADCGYGGPADLEGKEYSAYLHANGQLATCAWHAGDNPLTACVQNWDPSAPVLRRGKVDVIYQYRCQASSTAITCTVDTGTGKGKGFTISDTGVTPIP